MPHFSKPMMGGIIIPRDVKDHYLDLLTKRLEIFRRKYPKATLNTLLAHEMMVSRGLLEETMKQRRERMLENLDFKECRGRFRIIGSRKRIREIIEKLPDFEFEETAKDFKAEIFTWRRLGRSRKFEEMHPTVIKSDNDPEGIIGGLGRLILGDDCREKLIELMKEHINGLETLMEDKGIKISIDWVLKKLGLDELLLG